MGLNGSGNQPKENPRASILCPECPAGIMRLNYITYYTWLNDELITVPNFPAWVCDVCGRREFDPQAVAWLNALLNPVTGHKPARHLPRRGRTAEGDRPQL